METTRTLQLLDVFRRIAFWVIGWAFLIPTSILATEMLFDELVPVSHVAEEIVVLSIFVLPILASFALISGWWMRKARWNTMRLGVTLLTIDIYWYLFGKGITKFLFGGMG